MTGPIVELSSEEEVEALMAPDAGPAVIDFWSSTCGPCRAMAPHFQAAAEALADAPITFAKVQTDRFPHLARPFHIRAVPTCIFALRGEVLDVVVGAMSAQDLQRKARWLMKKAEGGGWLRRLFG